MTDARRVVVARRMVVGRRWVITAVISWRLDLFRESVTLTGRRDPVVPAEVSRP